MKRPFITITGADALTNLVELRDMPVEVGILYSAKQAGESKRFPSLAWIYRAAALLPHTALHVCGGLARLQLMADELDLTNFQRVQINGDIVPTEITKFLETWPDKELIIQYRDEKDNWMLELDCPGLSILVDASGGNGVVPAQWPKLNAKVPVGFAGGLGPRNLHAELPRIEAVAGAGCWIDMESQVRVDEWLSLRLVQQVLDAAAGHVAYPGLSAIVDERLRQVNVEGWSAAHDDLHSEGELPIAARCYLGHAIGTVYGYDCNPGVPREWPWEDSWWKPSNNPRRDLAKTGALVAAEIDRLTRAEITASNDHETTDRP